MSFGKFIIVTITIIFFVMGCGTSNQDENALEIEDNRLVGMLSEQLKVNTMVKSEVEADHLQRKLNGTKEDTEQEESDMNKEEEEKEEEVPTIQDKDSENSEKGAEIDPKSSEDGEAEAMRGEVAFRYITGKELTDNYPNVYQYYASIQNKDVRDWRIFDQGDIDIIVISGGLKNTGGHSIEVLQVTNTEGMTLIKIREKAPGPGAIVTQAFTNPVVIIAVESDKITNVIEVVDEFGNPFEPNVESM